MICSIQLDIPGCAPIPTRCLLFNWAYIKLVISSVLLLFSVYEIISFFFDYMSIRSALHVLTIFGVLTALSITDIVFQAKLIIGLKNKRLEYLKKYYGYSLILWAITPVVAVLYAIFSYNSLFDHVTHDDIKHRRVVTHVYIAFFSLLIQTLMMLLVKREMDQHDGSGAISIENDEITNNKKQIFDTEFSVKINLDGEGAEKEANNENSVAEIETTCEKAKLTE